MKYINSLIFRIILIPVIPLALVIASCSNPAGSDQEHHDEAVGAVLKMNGQEIARYENGEVSGDISVGEGEETALISIYFLSDDGDEFQPEEEEFTLSYEVADTSVAEVEQHEEDGRWRFHVRGLATGATTAAFSLYHEGHSDFNTDGIPVRVD